MPGIQKEKWILTLFATCLMFVKMRIPELKKIGRSNLWLMLMYKRKKTFYFCLQLSLKTKKKY
jgi:hypothetical protein